VKRRRAEKEEKAEGMERWLLSYADFITLLMVFFILMYSLSKVDLEKYNAIANSLSVVLTGSSISPEDTKSSSITQGESAQNLSEKMNDELINQEQLEAVKKQIQDFIDSDELNNISQTAGDTSNKLGDNIEVIEQERGLVISIKDTLLFPSGSDELNPQARIIMKQLGSALTNIPNYIRVEGHTDNLQINTGKFPSNWELSVLRASTVVHVLQDEAGISPERLSITGYGEYRPKVPNINAANQSKNRRVDVVILKKKYDDFEPSTAQQ
jgi:chemotaxis protein MotB